VSNATQATHFVFWDAAADADGAIDAAAEAGAMDSATDGAVVGAAVAAALGAVVADEVLHAEMMMAVVAPSAISRFERCNAYSSVRSRTPLGCGVGPTGNVRENRPWRGANLAGGRTAQRVRVGQGRLRVSLAGDRDGIADLIAVQEGRSPVPLLGDTAIRDLLAGRPRIALVGASVNPGRPAFGVMESLLAIGYDVVPVNPGVEEVLGLRCYPTVGDAVRDTGPIALVDVFRRPSSCEEHARDAVAAGAACLWLQLGIASERAGRMAHGAGLGVVMDRCTLIEHNRLLGGRRW
jgi:predicted CoA-binding protein